MRRIARLAALLLDAPAALLRALDDGPDATLAGHGLEPGEAAAAAALCLRVARGDSALLQQLTPAEAAGSPMRFLAAVPVIGPEGVVIGALAVLDRQRRTDVGPGRIDALRDLAALAAPSMSPAARHASGGAACAADVLPGRLKTVAVEAPGYEAAVQAAAQAICEAAGGLLCTLHRLGADGLSLHLVGGHAEPAIGGQARLDALRFLGGGMADPLFGAVVAEERQVSLPCGSPVSGAFGDLAETPGGKLALVATPLRIGEERWVLLLGSRPPAEPQPSLLWDAAATLRPLLQMLRDEEQMLLHRRVVESSSEAVLIAEAAPDEGRIVHVNPAFEALTGFAAAELVGRTAQMLQHRDGTGEAWRALSEAVRQRQRLRQGAAFGRKDGTKVWVELQIAPVTDASGRCTHVVAMVRDVTREREATQRLAASEAAFRSLFERNPIPMWIFDLETLAFLSVNDAALEDYGWSREEFLRMTILDIRPEEDREAVLEMARQPHHGRGASSPWRHLTADGREKIVQTNSHPAEFAGRRAMLVAVLDITARTRFEQDLAVSRAELQRQTVELRQTQRRARLGTWRWQPAARSLAWSEEVHAMFGTDPDGPMPGPDEALALVHPNDRAALRETIARIAASGVSASFDFRVLRPGGQVVHCRAEGTGKPGGGEVHGYAQDVTEQREAEERLRQADRLNSLGQLTGGIAHDFNNLLTVAAVSLEMAAEAMRAGVPTPDLIEAARGAVERGTRLTSQLLSFARRQPLRPEALDLGRLLGERLELMQRTLGERYTLRLDAQETEPVAADPTQLESALLNLLVNARDAMPRGGTINIATRAVTVEQGEPGSEPDLAPGRYTMIAVTDEGHGMPAEVRARIFEPFFTTKPPGRGTGLGLSMVLGFAQQSGGHVAASSEPGRGTTMRLSLPVVASGTEAAARSPEEVADLPEGLAVLVVEDQPDVRAAAVRLCREVGLQTWDVSGPAEALEALRNLRFDLLFTDVVLGPGMDGLALAEAALRQQPDLAVVCTSGDPAQQIARRGKLPRGLELLTKPYDVRRFRRAVGRALAAKREARASLAPA